MGQFHHDHVVKLYGVVTVVEPLMIVMEFMENGSLYTYLRVSVSVCGCVYCRITELVCSRIWGQFMKGSSDIILFSDKMV